VSLSSLHEVFGHDREVADAGPVAWKTALAMAGVSRSHHAAWPLTSCGARSRRLSRSAAPPSKTSVSDCIRKDQH
jgi:hypothetical protein